MKQLVWMLEVSRAINLTRRVYIVHAENEVAAMKIISEDITYKGLLKMPGGVRIKFTVLGVPIVGSEWGNKYILI